MTTTIKDFSYSFVVNASARETMERISQVNVWWAKKFKGKAGKLNDEFSVYFGGPGDTFVDFKISEIIPGKKIVWLVTDCNLHWINDKKEWKNTKAIWTLTEKDGKTEVNFMHKGLTPESECYDSCKPGWTHHLKDSFIKLVDEGKGFRNNWLLCKSPCWFCHQQRLSIVKITFVDPIVGYSKLKSLTRFQRARLLLL